jgi:hypothetical protein
VNQFQAPGADHYYGGGLTSSSLHPVVLAVLLVVAVLILTVPKKHIIVPFLAGVVLIPIGQQLYALGMHWTAYRIIVLAGLARAVMIKTSSKNGLFAGGFTFMDKTFVACTLCQAAAFVLLYRDPAALINQLGFLVDFLGAYFVVRAIIRDEGGIYRTLKALAMITVILAMGMVWEQVARQNVFGMLGGTRAVPEIREGRTRSQAAFQHSITAGVFGASLLPLFVLLWKTRRAKSMAMAGVAGCTVMTICSNSSTPLLTWAAGVVGICLWPVRRRMRLVRWALAVSVVALHLVMKSPVWFLIARIDLTGSSSGYHRAEVVDQFIRHFWEWWLIGTKDVGNWGWDMWDSQNEFDRVGVTGGLLALVLFILTIKRAYARIGLARKSLAGTKGEWQLWCLGTAMFASIVSFFGVNYYDQTKIVWFILLAMIVAATSATSGTSGGEVDAGIEGEAEDRFEQVHVEAPPQPV